MNDHLRKRTVDQTKQRSVKVGFRLLKMFFFFLFKEKKRIKLKHKETELCLKVTKLSLSEANAFSMHWKSKCYVFCPVQHVSNRRGITSCNTSGDASQQQQSWKLISLINLQCIQCLWGDVFGPTPSINVITSTKALFPFKETVSSSTTAPVVCRVTNQVRKKPISLTRARNSSVAALHIKRVSHCDLRSCSNWSSAAVKRLLFCS